MSQAYEREQYAPPVLPQQSPQTLTPRRQNDARLSDLASKVSALRGVTVDIYDSARDQHVIDSTSDTFSSFSTSLRGSAGRLTRMAQSGNGGAICKLAGMLVGGVVVLWWVGSWFF